MKLPKSHRSQSYHVRTRVSPIWLFHWIWPHVLTMSFSPIPLVQAELGISHPLNGLHYCLLLIMSLFLLRQCIRGSHTKTFVPTYTYLSTYGLDLVYAMIYYLAV
ncbi:hypothetical protein F4775DRAFT_122009 [Biscogniauxia sp. FL1348]|nr:hypothetical protein F4775DRAFT_122009 [Biscogniauxia sp. FL1348]